VRFPQIPCVKTGLEEVVRLLPSLLFSMGADPNAAMQWVKDAGKHLPEGLLPLIVASLQVPHRPTERDKLPAFLTTQAALFELAAHLPSILPKIQRACRFFAIRTYSELVQLAEVPALESRQACVAGIRRSLLDERLSATECRQYFQIVLPLQEFDLAHEILAQWDRRAPGQREVIEARVRLDIVSGAFASALSLLDRMLGVNPADAWALAQRQSAVENLQKLARANRPSSGD